jgi:hypothetical protein
LKVGQSAIVKRGILASYSVVYAGMLGDSTYPVVVIVYSGNRSMAYNLYLPKGQSEVELPKGRLVILNVLPEEVHFRYDG